MKFKQQTTNTKDHDEEEQQSGASSTRGGAVEKRRVRVQLTDRDHQVMGLLATARYLSEDQLARAAFPGRSKKTFQQRLLRLGAIGKHGFPIPYLRRLHYRTYAGTLVPVWALTEMGYRVAGGVLGREIRVPRTDVGASFLEHEVVLGELFVELVGPRGKESARARLNGWSWTPGESARLPWTQYDIQSGKTRERLVCPDAIFEQPSALRRVFIECETGNHSIEASSDEKVDSTLAKVERYEQFLNARTAANAQETFYSKAYPDNFRPELLFLVPSSRRAASVREAIKKWRRGRPPAALRVEALPLEFAVVFLRGVAPAPSASRSGTFILERSEVVLLRHFFGATIRAFQELRAASRSLGQKPPSYPPHSADVKSLLARHSTPSMAGRPL